MQSVRWMLLFLMCSGFLAKAQEAMPDWLGSVTRQVAQELSQWEFDPEALPDFVDADALNRARMIFINALASGSLDDLARLHPYAEQALRFAEADPLMRPFAAWLRPRIDFFQVADEVVHSRPPPAPARPAVPAPAVRSESDYAMWYEKISRRKPPSGAANWVPRLKPLFREEGIPEAMVWLAEVESSFDPTAESPAGASGLYQFMPATAERFGLSLAPKDERLNPYKSARAAAKYLKILHRTFGDWQLALAAYNAGEGRVGRLMERTGGKTFEEIAAHLPSETRMYVPKMRAVVQAREGVDLRTL